MKAPRVSVLIACYNGEKYLDIAVRSALQQTVDDLEVVVVNDGSTDRSEDVVRSFEDPRIRYVYQANRGLAATRNVLVSLARGTFLGFLDQDDIWRPDKLERQLPLFENAAVGLVYGDCDVIDANGRVLGQWGQRVRLHRGDVFEALLQVNFVPLLTVLARKSAIEEAGPFPPYKVSEEYDIFLKIARKHQLDFVGAPVASYRLHSGQTSRNFEVTLQEELAIFDYWEKETAGGAREALRRARARSWFNAGKNAIYLENDGRRARKHFAHSLAFQPTGGSLGFYALSFLPPGWVRRLRRHAAGAAGTFSFSE